MSSGALSVAGQILWLAREKSITPMELLKLAYISHGWMLGLYKKPLFEDDAEAWKYGPVIPAIYHRYKKHGGNPIPDRPEHDSASLSAEEKDLIQQVWKIYSKYNGLQLSALTHKPGTPWDITVRVAGLGAVISNDLIEDHYRNLAART